jgi:hypothetical protein
MEKVMACKMKQRSLMKASSIVMVNVYSIDFPDVYSMPFQVMDHFVHVFETATVILLAWAVVAVGKVVVSRRDKDTVTSSDMVNEVFCAYSPSRAKATATTFITAFVPAHFKIKN